MKLANSQDAFSILEVIISLFVISVVLVIFGASASSLNLNKNSRDQDLAHYIAVSELEDLRHGGYAAVPVSGSFTHPLLSKLQSATATLTTTNYNADTKQVKVVVTWKESGGVNSHSVSFTTLINKNGL